MQRNKKCFRVVGIADEADYLSRIKPTPQTSEMRHHIVRFGYWEILPSQPKLH